MIGKVVRHPTCLVKPDFFTLVAMIISYHSRVYVIQEHVIEKKSTQEYDETLLLACKELILENMVNMGVMW